MSTTQIIVNNWVFVILCITNCSQTPQECSWERNINNISHNVQHFPLGEKLQRTNYGEILVENCNNTEVISSVDSVNPEASVSSLTTFFRCPTYKTKDSSDLDQLRSANRTESSGPQWTFSVNRGLMYLQCFHQRSISSCVSHQNNSRLNFWQHIWERWRTTERRCEQGGNETHMHTHTQKNWEREIKEKVVSRRWCKFFLILTDSPGLQPDSTPTSLIKTLHRDWVGGLTHK